jgi:large subunit ribosomal protein L4
MSSIKLLDKNGKETKNAADFDSSLLSIEPNKHLIYLAAVRQQANERSAHAKCKTRAEVRGGGAKPWKQKGTGRARAGSSNSPLWRGGGVMFGPTGRENYTKNLNKKASKKAVLSALLQVINKGNLVALETLEIQEGKTKEMLQVLTALGLNNTGLLIVVETNAVNLDLLKRASGNIARVRLITSDRLNVVDMLKAEKILITNKALKEAEERFQMFVGAEAK